MDENCTVNLTVKYLTKKWTLLIILEIYKGENHTRRFSELKEKLGDITPKILSERLQELEEEGVVIKHVDASTVPVKSEYTLSERVYSDFTGTVVASTCFMTMPSVSSS